MIMIYVLVATTVCFTQFGTLINTQESVGTERHHTIPPAHQVKRNGLGGVTGWGLSHFSSSDEQTVRGIFLLLRASFIPGLSIPGLDSLHPVNTVRHWTCLLLEHLKQHLKNSLHGIVNTQGRFLPFSFLFLPSLSQEMFYHTF